MNFKERLQKILDEFYEAATLYENDHLTDDASQAITELVIELIGEDDERIIYVDEVGEGYDHDIETRNYLRAEIKSKLKEDK